MTVAKAWVYSPGARAQAVSLLEAMSCGAVLALARESFSSPLLRDGENVLLLEEQSAGDFALALNERLNNTDLLQKICQGARETVVQNFAQERVLSMQTRFLETMYQTWREKGAGGAWHSPANGADLHVRGHTHRGFKVAGSLPPGKADHTPEPFKARASNIVRFSPRNAPARFGGICLLRGLPRSC